MNFACSTQKKIVYVPESLMARIKGSWITFWRESDRRFELIIATSGLAIVMLSSIPFLTQIEGRQGVQLTDPVFSFLPLYDLSGVIFFMIYAGLIMGLVSLLPLPGRMVIAFETYALFVILRMIAMTVVPLEPPHGFIPLVDPVLNWIYTGKPVNKDLFFSGHTGTMYLVYLILPLGIYRRLTFLAAFVMAACLISQRVHYTIDVIVAPFFAYGALKLVLFLRERLGLPHDMVIGGNS